MTKFVIVAERSILKPHLSIVSMIARRVLRDPDTEIAIRASTSENPASTIERAMIEVARICDVRLATYLPRTDARTTSRAAIYHRDYRLVERADLVLAFFSEGSDMGGGTGHVIKAAIDRGIATMAYSVDPDGGLSPLVDGGVGDEEG